MKILIAENNPMEAEALILDLKEFFQKSPNFEILGPIASLRETREILKTVNDLSLAILDISLDDGEDSGIKIAKLISSVNNVPTIFMSGLPREKGFEVAKYAKPFSYLKKPYSKQDLWDSLELAIQYNHKSENWKHKDKVPENQILYLKTSPGEITPVKIQDIILIEADDKILNIFTENPFKKIVIGSPGLKNFYQEKLQHLRDFAQVNKKYVVNSRKIRLIKDNHLHMLPSELDPVMVIPKGFPKPIPLPSDVYIRNMIMKELGIK
ncbi:LytR/AlgR family response regulator transcription factor [Aquiflexum sp.]|uniref:LytR/AlgR family response regulator transcription factor n=1 Tax=Aquiflexum sp. TaxID=1872584 RepID=UPI0035942276